MQMPRRAALAAVVFSAFGALLLGSAAALAEEKKDYTPEVGQPGKDVVWVPTPDAVVQKMLDMAQVTKKDRLVDLGSGDGKIAIAAAKRGARAKGVEFNPDMVALSKRNAQAAGVQVELVRGDIFETDFSDADVLTLYLLPELNERLRPTILKMKPGTRVVSHQFTMGDWEPDEEANVDSHRALFWLVPARVAGNWTVQVADEGDKGTMKLQLRQRYQKVEGQSTWDGASRPDRGRQAVGRQAALHGHRCERNGPSLRGHRTGRRPAERHGDHRRGGAAAVPGEAPVSGQP